MNVMLKTLILLWIKLNKYNLITAFETYTLILEVKEKIAINPFHS